MPQYGGSKQLFPPGADTVGMTMARVLAGVRMLPAPQQAIALQQVYLGMQGPLRVALHRMLHGRDAGSVAAGLRQQILDPSLETANRFLNDTVAACLEGRWCAADPGFVLPVPFGVARAPTTYVEAPMVPKWRAVLHPTTGGGWRRFQDGEPLSAFTALSDRLRQGAIDQWQGAAHGVHTGINEVADRFAPLQHWILAQGDPVLAPYVQHIDTWRTLGCEIPDRLASTLMDGVRKFVAAIDCGAVNPGNAKSYACYFRRTFPDAPWLGELVYHGWRYRDMPPDDLRVILRVKRLLDGIDFSQGPDFGFTLSRLNAENRGINGHTALRSAAVCYDLPYATVAACYLRTVSGERCEALQSLPFFTPCFLGRDGIELQHVLRFLENPGTLGERIFFAQGAWGLDQNEAACGCGISPSRYADLVANRQTANEETLRGVGAFFGLPIDELFLLSLKTYFPKLWHTRRSTPRLQRLGDEPILPDPDKDDEAKLQMYQKTPGTFGELLFFLRKRRGLTMEALGERIGKFKTVMADYEWNRRRPTTAVATKLVQEFGVQRDALDAAIARTRVPEGEALKVAVRGGRVQPQLLHKWPRQTTVRALLEQSRDLPNALIDALNKRFAPDVQWTDVPSYRDGPFRGIQSYLAPKSGDLERITAYHKAGRVTLGEILWRARKDPQRLWTVSEAAKRVSAQGVHLSRSQGKHKRASHSGRLSEIEHNQHPPRDRELAGLYMLYAMANYGYTLDDLKALRDRGEHSI